MKGFIKNAIVALGLSATTQVGAQGPVAPVRDDVSQRAHGLLGKSGGSVNLYGVEASSDTNRFLSGGSQGVASSLRALPMSQITIDLGRDAAVKIGYEYNALLGSILSAGLVSQIGEDGAISVNVKVSKNMYNILTQAGYKVTEGVDAKITFSHISEKMNFDFASGSTTTRVPLNTFGATVRFTPQAFAKFVEITGYKINAKSFTLGQRDYIVETADVIQFWTDSRRVTGNSTRGAEIKANFPLFSDNPRANFTLGAGYQLSKWDTLIPTPETGGVTWNFRGNVPVSRTTDIHFEGSHQASFNRYGIGLSMQNGLFAEMSRELPTNVGKAQTTYRIGVNIALDGRPTSQSTSPFFNDRQNIRDFTSSQPTYVPNRASYNYKIDPTNLPFLSVSINKNDLPNNVEIDKKNAIMNITLDNPGTLESAINTSSNPLQDVSSAFQLNGNILVFRPGTINPNTLADGQNTILVTTSEGYIVNITVQKGSVEVVGVTITKKSKDATTNVGTTQVVSVTSNSFVLKHNISDPDGVRNLVCQQVDTTGKPVGNPVSMDSNGTCTIGSLLPDTRYNYIVTGEALDKSTNTWKSVSASSITVNTLQAPDVPPVANPDSYSVTVGQGIILNPLANDTATNGATLTLVSITQPQFGTLQKNSDGTYVYTGITAGEEKISYKVQTKPGISATGEITIKIDAKDQPGTIAAPVLSSSTSSSLSLVSGTVTGMTNVEFVLYSDMALTQEIARNSTGIFTGLSSGTTYYARTQALDLNENTGVSEVKKSPYIAVTTNLLDTEAPKITLNGDAQVTLTQGDAWTDPGATCKDNVDTTCVVKTTGTVITNTPGVYILTYTATDAAGKTGVANRTVTIKSLNQPGTITSPVLLSSTSSSLSFVPGAVSGMTNIRIALYTDGTLTNKIAENTSGIFTGLSPSTTYYVVTIADDINENTDVSEMKKSLPISATTESLAPPNVSGPNLVSPIVTGSFVSNPSTDVYEATTDLGYTISGFMSSDPDGLGSYTIISALFGTLASGTGTLPSSINITPSQTTRRFGQVDTITITSTDNHPTNPQTSSKSITIKLNQ